MGRCSILSYKRFLTLLSTTSVRHNQFPIISFFAVHDRLEILLYCILLSVKKFRSGTNIASVPFGPIHHDNNDNNYDKVMHC